MAAPAQNHRQYVDYVNLVSSDDEDSDDGPDPPRQIQPRGRVLPVAMDEDSESDLDSDQDAEALPMDRTPTPEVDVVNDAPAFLPPPRNEALGGEIINIDGEDVFIPDEIPFDPGQAVAGAEREPRIAHDEDIAHAMDDQPFTVNDCLAHVLEIFPDISHEYVTKLFDDFDQEGDYETLPGRARLDNILEQLVSASSYPKQEKGKQALKRKRQLSTAEDDDDIKKWERDDRAITPNFLRAAMQAMLKGEFPEIPVHYINDTLAEHKHFFQTFVHLAKVMDESDESNRPFGKGRPSTRILADPTTIAANAAYPEILEELNAARKRVQIIRAERAADEAKKQAERVNLQRAIEDGETAECSACFDDLPMNRQIHCNGPIAHFTCFDCAETYVKAEVGESRCRVQCTQGCGAGFATHQLDLLSDKQLLQKLAQLQQEKDIRDAGLDDLEECPFCDYKAILPPIEEDFEFRCANPECEKVSCRRCKSVSHIPVSCEQHAKDNKVNSRHKIEEAMTAALIRSCNKCKKQFVKEYGCNKMTCPSCGNMQCYVCSTTLRDYNHFDGGPGGPPVRNRGANGSKMCPLYDNVEERHEREVKAAEAAAREQVVSENPNVNVEDLEFKVSDAVKKATKDRIQRAGPAGMGGMGPDWDMMPAMPPPHVFNAFPDLGEDENDEVNRYMRGLLRRQPRPGRAPRRNALPQQQAAPAGRYVPNLANAWQAFAANNAEQPAAAPVAQPPAGIAPRYQVPPGPMQGFIPVYGLYNHMQPPPAPAPMPPAPQGAFGQQDQQRQNRFGDNANNYAFGYDGALDAMPFAAPNNQYRPNNNFMDIPLRNAAVPAPAANAAPPAPPVRNDFQAQLETLRQRNDERVVQRQRDLEQLQQRAHLMTPEQLQAQTDRWRQADRQARELEQAQQRQQRAPQPEFPQPFGGQGITLQDMRNRLDRQREEISAQRRNIHDRTRGHENNAGGHVRYAQDFRDAMRDRR